MIFLIEYDRAKGRICTMDSFTDAERTTADDMRLKLELSLNQLGTVHEVVLLQAASEGALRRTHRRYFENLAELV